MRYNCKVVQTPVLLGCNNGALPVCRAGANNCRKCGGTHVCARCDRGYYHVGGACLRKALVKRDDDHRKHHRRSHGGRH